MRVTTKFYEPTAEGLAKKEKRNDFIRNAVKKELLRESKSKTHIKITVKFANTGYYTNKELTICTCSVGRLKEKVSPLLEAVQKLQNVITYLDP